jgi:glutathione S-transferase
MKEEPKNMPELILHHYDMSPYAEKVRLMMGVKSLPWRSVQIPIVMPKPDLTELTGGYRRTPTLQIGADIYCDTKVCALALERFQPSPTLFPGDPATLWGLSRWAESSFMMAVTVFLGAGGLFDDDFIEDRKKMLPGADFSKAELIVPAKLMQLRSNLDRLEEQLSDGRPFLLGEAISLADLSAYHPHRFLDANEATAALVAPLERVGAWLDRIAAIGHGERSELDAKDAIAIARDAVPATIAKSAPLPEGLAIGDSVVVLPEEAGSGAVPGELVASEVHEFAIRRHSERAGELILHFPREDYLVVKTP